MRDFGEEISERECITCVAFYACALACRGAEDRTGTVEAQVCPRDEEAEPGKEQCSFCAKDKTRKCVGKEKYGREMFDAHADHFEKVDRVFGYELLEGNQEGGLEGDATGYCCGTRDSCVSY